MTEGLGETWILLMTWQLVLSHEVYETKVFLPLASLGFSVDVGAHGVGCDPCAYSGPQGGWEEALEKEFAKGRGKWPRGDGTGGE